MIMTTVSRYSGHKHFTSSVKCARTKKGLVRSSSASKSRGG